MSVQQTEIEEIKLEDLVPYEDNNDPNHRAHIVHNLGKGNEHIYQPGMTAQDIVDAARLGGIEVVALCGYRWVPKANPANHEVCQKCIDIWNGMA